MVGEELNASKLGHIHVLAVSPRGEIYAGFHEGVAVSYDGGETWRKIRVSEEKLEDFMALALNPADGIIYAGGHGHGVWRSDDSGETWRLYNQGLPAEPDVHALTVFPGNPDVVYATLSGDEMYISEDGGRSWVRMETGLDTYAITTLAVDPRDPGVIYAGGTGLGVLVSSDGGRTWRAAVEGLTSPDVTSVVIDSQGRLYAGTKAGIFVSRDGGKTWHMIKELGVEAFSINPSDPSYMVAASDTGFYRSTDGGYVWSVVIELEEEHHPAVEGEEELITISGPFTSYRPIAWEERGRDVEGLVVDGDAAFDGAFDDTSTYATVRAQGCDSNFAAVYEWTVEKGSGEPVLYYHWDFVKEVDRASIGVYNPEEDSWEELHSIIDMAPMNKRSLRIPEKYVGPGGKLLIYFEVVTPCSVGEMRLYDVYLAVPK
jgi:photosystem II stability/assembly factor-like uncharacterized protein